MRRPDHRDGLADVVLHESIAGVAAVALGVFAAAGEEVVDRHHLVAALQQAIHEVAADEASPAENDGAHAAYFTLP